MPSISRRTLLQGTGAMAVVGSLSGLIPETAHAMNSLGAKPELLNKRAGTVKYHSCLRNCADRCLMKFRVQDGRMTYVSGAEKQAKTGTCPCVKGLTYVEYTYAPDRILHPMERIGEKVRTSGAASLGKKHGPNSLPRLRKSLPNMVLKPFCPIPTRATTAPSACTLPANASLTA